MTEDIEKPCKQCGCEIHPLKTDYPPQRKVCVDCVKKNNAKRYKEYYEKRRKVSMELGLTDTVDCCLICKTSLRGLKFRRSKYCSDECSKLAVKLQGKVRSLAMMDRRMGEIRASQKAIRKQIKSMKKAGELKE